MNSDTNLKVVKAIRIILLVIACVMLFTGAIKTGIYNAQKAQLEKEVATDVSKIKVEFLKKKSYYKSSEGQYGMGYYHVDYTCRFVNNTKVDWTYLSLETAVYDKSGKKVGTITSSFGSSYESSDFRLKVGESRLETINLKDTQLYGLIETLYNSDLSSLRFETKITYGTYDEKSLK